ncbi:hypothetical protein J6590_076514 [Homalodisca vitripennis]|nr:hypothetical protein J6590_076514 [Homalodisca vitripennis]
MGRKYGKDKIDLFKDDLEKQDWTELYQSSGALLYNHLPEELKKEPAQRLKIQLTTWIQDRPFYTEKEFFDNQLFF